MSVASGFRAKWSVILNAADASRGQSDDARFSAMALAALDADLVLVPQQVLSAYIKTIADLRATCRDELTAQAQKLDMGY